MCQQPLGSENIPVSKTDASEEKQLISKAQKESNYQIVDKQKKAWKGERRQRLCVWVEWCRSGRNE